MPNAKLLDAFAALLHIIAWSIFSTPKQWWLAEIWPPLVKPGWSRWKRASRANPLADGTRLCRKSKRGLWDGRRALWVRQIWYRFVKLKNRPSYNSSWVNWPMVTVHRNNSCSASSFPCYVHWKLRGSSWAPQLLCCLEKICFGLKATPLPSEGKACYYSNRRMAGGLSYV